MTANPQGLIDFLNAMLEAEAKTEKKEDPNAEKVANFLANKIKHKQNQLIKKALDEKLGENNWCLADLEGRVMTICSIDEEANEKIEWFVHEGSILFGMTVPKVEKSDEDKVCTEYTCAFGVLPPEAASGDVKKLIKAMGVINDLPRNALESITTHAMRRLAEMGSEG
jgi:hypothetical protein